LWETVKTVADELMRLLTHGWNRGLWNENGQLKYTLSCS